MIGSHSSLLSNSLLAGVAVGYITLIDGDSIRTGVTAIVPHSGNLFQEKAPAAIFVGNGFGKLAGSTQVDELGNLETPVILTRAISHQHSACPDRGNAAPIHRRSGG